MEIIYLVNGEMNVMFSDIQMHSLYTTWVFFLFFLSTVGLHNYG